MFLWIILFFEYIVGKQANPVQQPADLSVKILQDEAKFCFVRKVKVFDAI